MRRLNRRERVLGVATAVVLLGGGVWAQVAQPAWARFRQQDEELFGLEQSVQRDRAERAQLSRIGAERRDLDASLRPPGGIGLIPWFIAHLRAVAKAASFAPSSLRYLRVEPVGAYAELRFELRARATSETLQAFLVRLAASERHVRVVALSARPRKSSDGMDVDMTLVALAPGDALPEDGQ